MGAPQDTFLECERISGVKLHVDQTVFVPLLGYDLGVPRRRLQFGIGLHFLLACQVFLCSVIMPAAQLDSLPCPFNAIELQACRALFCGPQDLFCVCALKDVSRLGELPEGPPRRPVRRSGCDVWVAARAAVAEAHGGLQMQARARQFSRARHGLVNPPRARNFRQYMKVGLSIRTSWFLLATPPLN
ncbi:unnamed protein product [Prorocentrum cordatum]|uniref:Uncharacterized protein n=1 Tax=Prorocentrum cordatum TaxID=2364126 RepID=A0ABN9R6B9_9DINO|nr:unnamed protein product [Polarella glacialis]